jgi:hypothetical protein
VVLGGGQGEEVGAEGFCGDHEGDHDQYKDGVNCIGHSFLL